MNNPTEPTAPSVDDARERWREDADNMWWQHQLPQAVADVRMMLAHIDRHAERIAELTAMLDKKFEPHMPKEPPTLTTQEEQYGRLLAKNMGLTERIAELTHLLLRSVDLGAKSQALADEALSRLEALAAHRQLTQTAPESRSDDE